MKKLFLSIMFSIFCISAFAVDYGFKLFSWNTPAKEVTKTLLLDGWHTYTDNTFIYFTPENMTYYYQNKLIKIKEFFISIDSNGNMTSQNIRTDVDFSAATAFIALLPVLQNDKALLINNSFDDANNINTFTYDATLPDCKAHYLIMGQEEYLMALSYRNF